MFQKGWFKLKQKQESTTEIFGIYLYSFYFSQYIFSELTVPSKCQIAHEALFLCSSHENLLLKTWYILIYLIFYIVAFRIKTAQQNEYFVGQKEKQIRSYV